MMEIKLKQADIRSGNERPWDLQIHNHRAFQRVLSSSSLGAGESYMEGWWDCEQLNEMISRVLSLRLDQKYLPRFNWLHRLQVLIFNSQFKIPGFAQKTHYDLGNALFSCMLDKRMIYSCAYWKDAKTLEEAQEAKMNLLGRKLMLEQGILVLDIGCGWGGTAKFLAERYCVRVVGITISQQQLALAQQKCQGFPVDIRLQDYLDLDEKFDRIYSVGMFEHVGYKNYRSFFDVIRRCLDRLGIFLLHTIGNSHTVFTTDPWIRKYIFPNSMIPSAKQITEAAEGRLVLEDWHNFGIDYDRTFREWYRNFARNWSELKSFYDERFFRLWKFYLLSCAGSFRARRNHLWQIVFTLPGLGRDFVP